MFDSFHPNRTLVSRALILYLHIPFCHRVCPYCSFYKHTPGNTPIASFIDALCQEVETRISHPPRTIYLGGGTPSMLSPAHLRKLFAALHEHIDFDSLEEVTLEANPATFDDAKAELFRQLGVTRVSLGIQSFSPHVLQTLGREHNPQQATESIHLLRRAGIPEINIDLMFSIPGQSLDDWRDTLQHTISLQPHHISAYNLTYEEDTAFFESLRKGEVSPCEDKDAEHFDLANQLLGDAGYLHYETSNHAQPGHESRHNQAYWNGEDYIGLGPSAISTIDGVRCQNIPDTQAYIQRMQSIGQAIQESEILSTEQQRIERIALGLRTTKGIPLTHLDEAAQQRCQQLVAEGLAQIHNGRLSLRGRGRALVDPIAAELI